MKKILITLLTVLLLTLSIVPIFGETNEVTKATGEGTTVKVSGTVDSTIKDAVAIVVTKKGSTEILSMQTVGVKNGGFTASIYVDMNVGEEYTVKVANFNGGDWFTKDFIAKEESKPTTPEKEDDKSNDVVEEVKTVTTATGTGIKVKVINKSEFDSIDYKDVDETAVIVSDNSALEKTLDSIVDVFKDLKKTDELPPYIEETESGAILAAIKAGKTFSIQSKVSIVNDSEVIEDVAKIVGVLSSKDDGNEYQIEAYLALDIELFAGKDKVANIKELDGLMEFAIALPQRDAETLKDKEIYVARIHNDDVDLLNATLEGNIVKFKTDKFSTYALVSSNKIEKAKEETSEPAEVNAEENINTIEDTVQPSKLPIIIAIIGVVIVAAVIITILFNRNRNK